MGTTAAGAGLATLHDDGTVLEVWFPHTTLDPGEADRVRAGLDGADRVRLLDADPSGADPSDADPSDDGPLADVVARLRAAAAAAPPFPRTRRCAVLCVVDDLDAAPVDAVDVYLRLRLLSERLVQPHGANLDGAFGLLANVAWTADGPVRADEVDQVRFELAAQGRGLQVRSIDKFPRMTDHVVPSGVRIGDADRVRLGAHLAAGTTVMHEGFVNFNAGTLGSAMIEGRISAGVVVGDGSDLGGSASVMGTLSGGGREVVRIGAGCLVGANAGIGISLGDGCVVEAGLYVTAGTKVTREDGTTVAARELSGTPGLLFRRNSLSGAVEVLAREGDWGALTAALHDN